jgi:hypothetical protein
MKALTKRYRQTGDIYLVAACARIHWATRRLLKKLRIPLAQVVLHFFDGCSLPLVLTPARSQYP